MSWFSVLVVFLILMTFSAVVLIVLGIGVFLFWWSKEEKHPSITADHFAFEVSDLKKSVEFYTNQLGLKLLSTNIDEEHHEAFAFIELGGGNLELLQMLDEDNKPLPILEKKEFHPLYCPHLAMKTRDMDKLVRSLREKNLSIVKGPLEIPGTVRWLYLADPDNNILEFVQWL
ncbi:MAG TPA: VOC family protein [bacterium]|nr:VOC family protein [bacterium]HQL61838.1 VOC family protein [bacterium]